MKEPIRCTTCGVELHSENFIIDYDDNIKCRACLIQEKIFSNVKDCDAHEARLMKSIVDMRERQKIELEKLEKELADAKSLNA
jgi:hypothetical protein